MADPINHSLNDRLATISLNESRLFEFPYSPGNDKEPVHFMRRVAARSRYPKYMSSRRFSCESGTIVYRDRVVSVVRVTRVE